MGLSMKIRTATAVSVVTASLTVMSSAFAQAAPADEPGAQPSHTVHYTARLTGKDVVLTLDRGSFDRVGNVRTRNGVAVTGEQAAKAEVHSAELIEVRDSAGTVDEKIPLWFRLNGVQYPIKSVVSADKRQVTLTPVADAAKVPVLDGEQARARLARLQRPGTAVVALPQAKEIASPEEDSLAQNSFNTQLGIATTTGSLIGTAIGVALGIPVGVIAAGAACVLGVAFLLVGCFLAAAPAFLAVAGVGGVIGTVIAGGGALVTAGWDLIQTLRAAPHSTHYQAEIDQRNAKPRR
jgi:hypothetical protein